MAIVNTNRCEECQHLCKIKTDERVKDALTVVSCPKDSKGFKRKKKTKKTKKKK